MGLAGIVAYFTVLGALQSQLAVVVERGATTTTRSSGGSTASRTRSTPAAGRQPMTTADYVARHVLPAAFALLPPQMDSPQARAMLMAIGWQESRFSHRRPG